MITFLKKLFQLLKKLKGALEAVIFNVETGIMVQDAF
jgi:hypothetical protein